MPRALAMPALLLTAITLAGAAALPADDAEPLRERIKDEHARGTDLWVYNDISQAMARARIEDKPIFVTFRCVPCEACKGFDAEVAQGSEVIERLAREKFISVRQVEMKGVDLSLFQFDYDLNWAAMFINADGVVYARYGTQSVAGPDAYNSITGLHNTMLRVLELHQQYPLNKAALQGKRGAEKPYQTALEMPGLENKQQRRGLTTRSNCIHCHNIHDAEFAEAHASDTFTHDLLWRYPLPENLGLIIDPDHGRRIKQVEQGSPAARAGLEAGEEVQQMNRQPITSIADMQWVLDRLPNTDAQVQVQTSRGGTRTLQLAAGWKKSDISWRGSMWSVPPKLRFWAPPADAAQRAELNIADDESALVVRWINRDSKAGRSAYQAGLRQGDVITAVAGQPFNFTPQQFNLHVKLNYQVGDRLPLTIVREGQSRQLEIELVE